MKKIFYTMFVIVLLITCSMLFVSCAAITAQNIDPNSFSGANGGILGINGDLRPGIINNNPRMNASPGRDSNPGINADRSGSNKNANRSFMKGKIVS
ncbi:hypothetical protein [Clostridium sp. BL-8]|uniref:hypothetical protein n=1 Tax=Clostridium sp. BL-8 TaxID=349938 RepID=UPI00098BE3E9|nr:hypothetical protein [Clostridium sp. BL-8]OOM78721.1 hypothetical protein CLOBL_21360 [Clostridium sp. BL-8]